jgi:hypothetical protein
VKSGRTQVEIIALYEELGSYRRRTRRAGSQRARPTRRGRGGARLSRATEVDHHLDGNVLVVADDRQVGDADPGTAARIEERVQRATAGKPGAQSTSLTVPSRRTVTRKSGDSQSMPDCRVAWQKPDVSGGGALTRPKVMWIFTTDGFFSAVADRNRPGHVVVRMRLWDDGERLQAAIGAGEVIETRGADYRFRICATHSQWSAYLAAAAAEIDYPNFKAAVAARDGMQRAHIYSDVWAVMRELQGRTP